MAKIRLSILDPVGIETDQAEMITSTNLMLCRSRLVFFDENDRVLGSLKVIDDGNENIINIILNKNL